MTPERAVFLLLMPVVLAFANGWAQTNEGISFTRLQSVAYWLTGALPCWWLNAALTRLGAGWAPLSRGIGFWIWAACVPAVVFIGLGLAGFFTWRWETMADAFLGYVPLRARPDIGSAAWFIWMAKGSVVPIVLWTAAILLQRQLYGRTPLQPAQAMAEARVVAASQDDAAVLPPADSQPDFLKRLERPLTDRLLAVQAQEHYIRVIASDQTPMLLYRFSDALEQLKACRGLRVHRSYWVSLDAIEQIERDGPRMRLCLRNGERVPKSAGATWRSLKRQWPPPTLITRRRAR
ncbi:MAG: LytTR family transcriptional regulator DNA-binding domain-containing protein [Steroidobacteraceae bacterium]